MSGTATPSARTDALMVVPVAGVQISIEFKVDPTTSVFTAKIETTFRNRVASTFSEQNAKLIHISTSATVSEWRRVARLARIAVDEDEIVELCTQLNSIMSFVNHLSAVDVEGIEPMTSVTPMKMKMRDDKVTDGGIPDAILANAPVHEDHFFVVPKVVE
jgi:aspartyl-tRNA(Asn)/glutamyl-tRNA(Gln) amidotransferase subunit C